MEVKKPNDLEEFVTDLVDMWRGDTEIMPIWLSRAVVVSFLIVFVCLLIVGFLIGMWFLD